MVDSAGLIRILDFGIARVANSGMTSDGAMMGTLNYMSPEQMVGKPVDYRSDIFSVGALAYELLSYHQAFPGTLSDGLLHRLPHENPAPLAQVCPGLPPHLDGIVMRALAKQPPDRFGDLEEMRIALRNVRRELDPRLEVETVVIPSAGRPKSPTRPGSSEERRGLLERRARQIAIHRDAARAALALGDLDSASAACEDALTLDPDDAEASQLLVEIQQQKERRDQESKARHERERTTRRRVADAELALQRGDVASAARQLERVLSESPHERAAHTLLVKVREAATATGITLSDALNADTARQPARPLPEHTAESTRPTSDPESRGRKTVVIAAAAAVVVLVVGGGLFWMRETSQPVAPASQPSTSASNTPAPSGAEVTQTAPAPVPAPAPAPVPAPAPGPVPAAPRSAAPSPPVADPLAAPLARIEQLYRAGNFTAALAELDRISPSIDRGVAVLERWVAQAAAAAAATASAATAKPAAPPVDVAPAPAIPAPVPEPPPPVRAEASPPPRTEAPAAAASAALPRSNDSSGIFQALTRYQDAYRKMDVDALKQVYPNLGREPSQRLARQFKDCRTYDVTFGNIRPSFVEGDPTSATVAVQTTYTCEPRSRQASQPQTVQDFFSLKKFGDEWLIDRLGGDMQRR
jgi:hypothetical protein